jgi:hypothetical protein
VSGQQRLVARGLYRPEITPAEATRQVFQLHPNGWHFAAGHVAKLELLPADQPYGRNSNGQAPVTVSSLELRLPVVETPDCGLIQDPAAKEVPPGYALAADFVTSAAADCTFCARSGCAVPAVPGKSRLTLTNKSPDTRDRLVWKLSHGPAIDPADLGDPLGSTGYALCAYDGTGQRILSDGAPAGGTCGDGTPCWKATSKGFRYVDRELTPDGIQKLELKAGAAGKSKLTVKGKGGALGLPPLPIQHLPITVQLVSGEGRCWETTFSSTQRNLEELLKAKSD